MKRFFYIFFPVTFVLALIFYFSSLSVLPKVDIFLIEDKILHFLAFFALGYSIFRIFFFRSMPFFQTALLVILLSTAYGLGDEIHQLYVPNRVFDWYDLLADFLGAFASVLFGPILFRFDRFFGNSLLKMT